MTSSCDCIRNVSPCAIAERLWDDVADAHHVMAGLIYQTKAHRQAYEAYLRAQALYEAHFARPTVAAVQPSFLDEVKR